MNLRTLRLRRRARAMACAAAAGETGARIRDLVTPSHMARVVACVIAVTAVVVGPASERADSAAAGSSRAAAGAARVDITGPATVTLNSCCVPPKQPYTFAVTYLGAIPLGPASGPPGEVQARFTITLPTHLHSMEVSVDEGSAGVYGTATSTGPRTFWGPEWTVFSVTVIFQETRRTATFRTMIRPSGLEGPGTVSAELDTGDRATFSTTFVRQAAPPPPPPAAPAPLAGPPAAPTKTAVETFTQPGETETQSATIAPSAETTQVALTWPDADSSFDATGFRIVRDGQVVARALQSVTAKVRPGKLRVSKRRTARSLDVRIKGLRPGRLIYKIVARRLDGRTRVVAKVRQSKRG